MENLYFEIYEGNSIGKERNGYNSETVYLILTKFGLFINIINPNIYALVVYVDFVKNVFSVLYKNGKIQMILW